LISEKIGVDNDKHVILPPADVRQFGGRLVVTTTEENHRRAREVIAALNTAGWTP
jgi:hypothetical protein